MRRVFPRLSKTALATATPAVADFWTSCVSTATVAGPNMALSKVGKVNHSLQKLSDEADAGTTTMTTASGDGTSNTPQMMTKTDAVLHANITARLSATNNNNNNTIANSNNNNNNTCSNSATHLALPEFIYRRKTRDIANEADKIYNAYREYYNHIKFRNKWEEPVIPQSDEFAIELLREASDICARIRARLDEENPSTKLRQADGSAQVFFNSPDCAKLYQAATAEADANEKILSINPSSLTVSPSAAGVSHFHRREFIKSVVLATFKDAMGFVEGLTKSKLERYFADISDFGFNPSAHMQHLLLEMLASTEVARLSFDITDAHLYEGEAYGIVSQSSVAKNKTAPLVGAAEIASKEGEGEAGADGVTETPETKGDVNDTLTELELEPPTVSRRALDRARQSRDNAHFCAEDSTEDKLWRDAIGKLYKAHDALLLALAERKKNAIKRVKAVSVVNSDEISKLK